jgi:hypothetical protein
LCDCFERVEGVGKTALPRGRRHELRHALRAGAAYCRRVEAALLPDQPGEEIDRQIIFRTLSSKAYNKLLKSGKEPVIVAALWIIRPDPRSIDETLEYMPL